MARHPQPPQASVRTRKRGVIFVVLLLVVMGAGVGWFFLSPGQRGKDPLLTEVVRQDDASELKLLSVGEEPRVDIEVGRWTGLKYKTRLEQDSSLGFKGQALVSLPTVIVEFESEVTRGTADPVEHRVNGVRAELVEEEVTLQNISIRASALPEAHVALLNELLKPWGGTTMTQRVAPDGRVVEAKAGLLGGVAPPDELKAHLDRAWAAQIHVPFRLPPVPVGKGARWRFTQTLDVGDVHAVQSADIRVVSSDKDTARVKLRLRQDAPRQYIPHPMDPSESVLLEHYRAAGGGELLLDLVTGIPLKGRLTTTSQLTVGEGESRQILSAMSVLSITGTVPDVVAKDASDDGVTALTHGKDG